ncbi:Protein of unknown function [Variovorax sp. HW608]|uniref:DUF2493 domain-containing protein n=1 Tax=Variovorax sp. HW608 TaxID=1034889 RepID=UPI00081FD3D2|nr:DUF2493 domain-containing protein [Variovorax sp. HW608]SCK33324.1 Protein of unknown function [Variovorax sp. HW608]
MRVLVCGGHRYDDWAFIVSVLDRLHARRPVTLLIEGGATGADNLARRWALARGIEVATYRADWDRYQHRAEPIRNAQMLREGRPELAVAFKGGRATAHMVTIASAALVPAPKTWRLSGQVGAV